VQKLSSTPRRRPYDLDELLTSVTLGGAYVYAIFSAIAAGAMAVDAAGDGNKGGFVLMQHLLLLVQISLQGLVKKNIASFK
jgi:hypothetical protein